MKSNILLAIVLILVGVSVLGYQGYTYTTKEKIVDIGPLTMTADKTRTIPILPIAGGLVLIGGIALLFMGRKNTI